MPVKRRVFVESSLDHESASAYVPVECLAPSARRGDILRAVADGVEHIVLIDGYFGFTPSVWHKEILYALSQGVTVTGAASMGALRAVELAPYGMQGVGAIYQHYATHPDTDDAEVATFFQGEKGEATVPLINIRLSVEKTAPDIITQLARIHYTQRTWAAIGKALTPAAFSQLKTHYKNYKKTDAHDCLATLAQQIQHKYVAPPFVDTFFFQRLMDETFYPNEMAAFLVKAEKILGDVEIPIVCREACRIRELAKLLDTTDFGLCHKLMQHLLESNILYNVDDLHTALTRWRMREQLMQGEAFKHWCLDRALNFAMLEQTFMDYFLLKRLC